MIKLILIAVVLCLACLGLAEIIHCLKMIFITPKSGMNTFAVVWLKGEDAVRMLNAAGTQLNWLGRRYAEHRIAVFDSLTREDIKLCAKIAKKYDMIYCPPAMAGHILSTVANAKEVPDVGGKQGSNKGNG